MRYKYLKDALGPIFLGKLGKELQFSKKQAYR